MVVTVVAEEESNGDVISYIRKVEEKVNEVVKQVGGMEGRLKSNVSSRRVNSSFLITFSLYLVSLGRFCIFIICYYET